MLAAGGTKGGHIELGELAREGAGVAREGMEGRETIESREDEEGYDMDEKRERKEGLNAFEGRQSKCTGCIEAGGQEGWTGDEQGVKEKGIGLVSMED